MIVKISQTASNTKQTFDIESDTFYFHGEAGSFDLHQPITLLNRNTKINGIYHFSKLRNYIPFRWLWGKTSITRIFRLYKNDSMCGSVAFYKKDFMKNYYLIELDDGTAFRCYFRAKDTFNYISIYHGKTQVALVETDLSAKDYKYTHRLYILEDYDRFADILSFFVLYYSNYHFCKRFHMSKGYYYVKVWSFSRYNNKYDPEWRKTNFPDENVSEK